MLIVCYFSTTNEVELKPTLGGIGAQLERFSNVTKTYHQMINIFYKIDLSSLAVLLNLK